MSVKGSDDEVKTITSLKIQVDNDFATNNANIAEYDDDDEIEEGEASGTASEDEIEVNVIVDSQNDARETDADVNNRRKDTAAEKKYRPDHGYGSDSLKNYVRKDYYKPSRKEAPTYSVSDTASYDQYFTADLPYELSDDKLEERTVRFGISMANNSTVPKAELVNLYESLDITPDDFHRGGWRPEAIHMRGIENLKSHEIFEYFNTYSPHNIEWLNKETCNVVFSKKENAAKALISLSCPIIDKRKKHSEPTKEPQLPGKDKSTGTKSVPKTKQEQNKGESHEVTSSSGSSSEDSSSSESEDEDGSSSDSSSSSSSSSDSESDSSSSNSSSDSDDESSSHKDEEKEKDVSNNNNIEETPMEVEHQEEQLGSVSVEDVGVPVPSGRWRLGVPCPNTKALLLRYAHCKDMKVLGLEKPVDFFEEYLSKKSSRSKLNDREKRHRESRESRESHRRHHRKEYEIPKISRNTTESERREWPPRRNNTAGYVDLDDPFGTNKNPWGSLAQNWGKKETQDSLDYQSLLQQHVIGQKRKRESEPDSDLEEEYYSRKHRPKRERRKKPHSEEDYSDDDESDSRDDAEDIMAWKRKIRLPRMRMYADAEERRRVKRRKQVKLRIGPRARDKMRPDSFPTKNKPVFDLRAVLQNRTSRKKSSTFYSHIDD